MESTYVSDSSYSTTPLKSDGGQNAVPRRQVYDRNSSNPYKTPIRYKVNQIIKGNLSKPNAYRNNVIEKMPIYSPPPKNISFVKNPFEHARLLKERLSQPICSPSIFQTVVSPSQVIIYIYLLYDQYALMSVTFFHYRLRSLVGALKISLHFDLLKLTKIHHKILIHGLVLQLKMKPKKPLTSK